MLLQPWSRCFKRIGGMQSMQKFSRKSNWPHYIPIHNLPPLEKDKKSEQAGIGLPHTLSEKNKEDCIPLPTNLSRQKNYPFLKNVITSQQVFKAISCIGTELLCIVSSWSSYLCSSMWRGPQEYVTYECPTCLVHLTLIVFMMSGRWRYSCYFVECCLQDLFNIAHSILV